MGPEKSAIYGALLDEDGHVAADAIVVSNGDDLLIDCDTSQTEYVKRRIESDPEVTVADESAEWHVLTKTHRQDSPGNEVTEIKFADPRLHHMGTRILRASRDGLGRAWQSEGYFRAHRYRLGIASGSDFAGVKVTPFEANLHGLQALPPGQCAGPDGVTVRTCRRILPFRIEPSKGSVPVMTNAPIEAGERHVGAVIDHEGLFGLALVELDAWSAALADRQQTRCLGEQLLIVWPAWIARESSGKASPAAYA